MQEAEFREWLQANGANTEAGRNTRVHAVKTIERKLADLGSTFTTLADAWTNDRFQQLRERIRQMRQNAREGGQDFRILMPESEKPFDRLSNWNSWLAQYGTFLAGEQNGHMKDADRIRQHVLEHYIEPAREAGRDLVEVLVSDVNRALGLNQAWPNICQALAGKRFQDLAEVPAPERIGADQSSATVFRFLLGGTALGWAEAELRRRYAEPTTDTEKVVGFALPDGRHVALQRDVKGTQIWIEDTGSSPPVQSIRRYAAGQPRHSNLPGRLKHRPSGGNQPRAVTLATISNPDELRSLLDWYEGQQPLNRKALEALRRRFEKAFSDFSTFEETSSGFHRQEDNYKRDLIQKIQDAMATHAGDDEALGSAVLDLVLDRSTNLIGNWRTYDHLITVRQANRKVFDVAAGALTQSKDSSGAAIEIFLDSAWPLISAGQEASMPYGDSRILPTLIFALVRPNEAIAVRYTPFNNAALMLLGRPAFANAPLSAQEFEDMIALARTIERVMRDDWGWKPRDLWDVQGFIWATCQKRLPADQIDQNSVPTGGHIVQPTNLILFGPPGTGKTYATAREAVCLCRPELDDDEPMFADTAEAREDLLREFRRLKDVGQIDFVTFHQSYAYEDFVEGLRPPSGDEDESPSDEGAALRLLVKPGIFRNIVSTAEEARTKPRGSGNFDMAGRQVFKMSLGRAGVEDHIYEAALEGNYVVLGWGGELDWSDPKYEGKNAWQAIYDRWLETDPTISPNSGRVAQLWRFRASMKEGDLVVVSWGNKHFRAIGEIVGPYYFEPTGERTYSHKRNVKWLYIADEPLPTELIYAKPFVQASCYLLKDAALKSEGLARLLSTSTPDESGIPDQFALIIDEINRANISKVFGELITLLEPDKRLGMREAVKVRLPYSGKEFGVPANLHIIGTMNTADRSIALLDTALRRRFKFKEVPPEPELLVEAEQATGLPLVAFLRAINDRIEYLLDREHRIGHAYFINCSTGDEVDAAMRDAVIPLLQEYFFEDLSRVAIVLGEAKGGGFLDYREIKDPLGESDARPSWTVRPAFAPNAYDHCIKSAAPSQPAEPGDETSE